MIRIHMNFSTNITFELITSKSFHLKSEEFYRYRVPFPSVAILKGVLPSFVNLVDYT